ncbi:MAG: radical SAM protein [Calditrichaeota bacterium]|nr:MAG: radical SAM protein [Calditrichota bacterium]
MNTMERIIRHARLSWKSLGKPKVSLPPFLILFINSICNLTCDHCFYWRNLNKRDDLTVDEIFALSDELGKLENLNLSGGEPFIRKEFAEICRYFIQNNDVDNIYVPSNGYFTKKTIDAISEVLREKTLQFFVIELSLDGMPEFHNKFRGNPKSFEKAMETYDALAELQKQDPRLRIHAISTATHTNMDEIQRLTTYLYERCPQMEHHNIALIRGDRKDPTLKLPDLQRYRELMEYANRLWAPREESRFGSIVEPMLQWAKIRTAEEDRQVIPCKAGVLSCVINANGDVSFCENHKPLGNLREKSFREIWYSAAGQALRESIWRGECSCTNEIFLWPSFTYSPVQLVKTMIGARVWQKPDPLNPDEYVKYQQEEINEAT